MNNDILPPGQRKTNTAKQKKPAELDVSTSALDKVMPKPDASIDLKDDKKLEKKRRFAFISHLKHHHWHHMNKAEKIMMAAGALLIVIALFGCIYAFATANPQTKLNDKIVHTKKKPVDNRVAAPLTGLLIDPTLAKRPVTAIMIENSLDARPQSGLQDAGVVFEAIAEAGIKRFLELFQDTRPGYIGPVRSLRPYYIDFGWPYQAAIAHVGGSP